MILNFKKLLIMLSIFLHLDLNCSDWLERRYEALIKDNSSYTFDEYKKELEFWKERIPNNLYLHAIVDNAIIENIQIEYIYSISHTETGNFRYMKSLVPNKNGTIDYGLMAINSANLSNQGFMSNYFYDERFRWFDPNNQFHITRIGVKYFKSLLEKTDNVESALKSYNCGYHAWMNNRVPDITQQYASKISNLINKVSNERQGYLYEILMDKVEELIAKKSYDNNIQYIDKLIVFKMQKLYTRRYLIHIDGELHLVA